MTDITSKEAQLMDLTADYILSKEITFLSYGDIGQQLGIKADEASIITSLITGHLESKGFAGIHRAEEGDILYAGDARQELTRINSNGGFTRLHNEKMYSGMTPKEIIINQILSYLKSNKRKAKYQDIDNAFFGGNDTTRRFFNDLHDLGIVNRDNVTTEPVLILNPGFEHYIYYERSSKNVNINNSGTIGNLNTGNQSLRDLPLNLAINSPAIKQSQQTKNINQNRTSEMASKKSVWKEYAKEIIIGVIVAIIGGFILYKLNWSN